MRGMKIRIITCVTLILYYCLGISDKDNSVSRTHNFMNVFNSTSPRVFSYGCVFALFLHNASEL